MHRSGKAATGTRAPEDELRDDVHDQLSVEAAALAVLRSQQNGAHLRADTHVLDYGLRK